MDRAAARLKLLAFVVAFMFVALSTRLWFLQVLAGPEHLEAARDNSIRTVTTDALRGDIEDRDGVPLVGNRLSLEVRIKRDELGDRTESTLSSLSGILGVPARQLGEEVETKLYYSYQPVPVAEFVPEEVFFKIREEPEKFPGVEVVEQSVRSYPRGNVAAHVLGWVGQITREELESDPRRFERYGPSDLVGKTGIEATYERWLRGTPGKEVFVVNSDGEVLREFDPTPPEPGHDLVLELDLDVQRIAEEELKLGIDNARTVLDASTGRNLVANAGAVVVLDPRNGGVVAMASWPTFQPSWFVRGLTRTQEHLLFESEQAPTLNRATQLTYAPGSTFKPFVALAAVKEGIASLTGYYDCPAEYTHPNDESGTVFHNWDGQSAGTLSIADGLRVSCDTQYYAWGSEFYFRDAETNGQELQRRMRQWGFGRPTLVDLHSEASGTVPDREYVERNRDRYPVGWIPGIDILLAIGSGEMKATPLQLAQAYGALATGKLCRPHVVSRIEDREGEVVRRVGGGCRPIPYSEGELDYIRNALHSVTTSGTATSVFAGCPFDVAGKTGTAERQGFQDTSWFAGITPVDRPAYVVVAMVEQGGFGAETAAPIVRNIMTRLEREQPCGAVLGEEAD
ncbi:MAG TPA: penicillin-binding protein 2 [Actinomycetota bacterium]|nr:penicillin-binding protein 2 [Actinomycetota bacterium]